MSFPDNTGDYFNVPFHNSYQERAECLFRTSRHSLSSSSSPSSPSPSSSPPINPGFRRQVLGSRPVAAPIAIAPKKSLSAFQPFNALSMDTYAVLPKPKLPPRSRNGCWTCRSRKVKCDEMHPKCGQCDRLQHDCDYTRRLSFRDDTNRVKQRNVEVSIVGSVVWDSQVSFSHPTPQELADAKLLPPFSHLSNDEERELKALLNKPGTYHVILGPKSFENCQDLEMEGENDSSPCATPGIKSENRMEDEITWDFPGFDRKVWPNKPSHTDNESVITDDSETVFIRTFEDLSSPTHSKTSFHKQEKRSFSPETSDNSRDSSLANDSALHYALQPPESEDAIYAIHYKRYISLHFMQIQEGFSGTWDSPQLLLDTPDIFERQSKNYPRLHEAMMALAAQNYCRENGISNVKALERAQRALPVYEDMHMRNVDMDALFSTHFFLLVYEITAAELGGDCLWQSHLDQMRRIILSKSGLSTDSRQVFITWFLVVIDTHASLSANGNGELAKILDENNLIPDAHLLIPPSLIRKKGGVSEVERNAFVTAMRANQEIILLGASMARIARNFRDESSNQTLSPEKYDYHQRTIEEINEKLKRLLWNKIAATVESFKKHNSYGQCALILQRIYEEAQAFVHACILYGYASIYPSQLVILSPPQKNEIDQAISAIISQTKANIYQEKPFQLKYLAFPLFLVGALSQCLSHKKLAVEFLSLLERECLGHNIKRLRSILHEICEEQCGREAWSFAMGSHWEDGSLKFTREISWDDVLRRGCGRLVNFAF